MKTQMIAQKRVIFSCGGKGGVGKTVFMSTLAEWLAEQQTSYTLLYLDIENKNKGSLHHFFPAAQKVNVNTPAGLDAFVDLLDENAPVLMADMRAGAAKVTQPWFDAMHNARSA